MTPDFPVSPASSAPDERSQSLLGCEVGADGVPRVSVESLVAEGRRQQTIGMGGNRGALVHLVDKRILRYRVYKEYIPPRRVSSNEIAFMAACYRRLAAANNNLVLPPTATSGEDGAAVPIAHPEIAFDAAQLTLDSHLVIPDALVMEGKDGRGVLMPLLHGNLFQILSTIQPVIHTKVNHNGGDMMENDEAAVLRSHQEFAPIRDPTVIAALLYQITQGVVALNYGLPHVGPDGSAHSGFSHNDLHLANLLVHYDSGSVVLCDFELVEHLPPPKGVDPPCERVPCRSRHPPFGLWREPSDVWGLGLLAVDLLTGVVPVVDAEMAFDDFGEGPLLELPSNADPLPVIDWDTNLAEHVAAVRGVPVGACRATDELYDFCRACLSNTPEQEEAQKWTHSKELLELPCMQPFVQGEVVATEVVKQYLDQYTDIRPNVFQGRSLNCCAPVRTPLVISTPDSLTLN